MWPGGRWQGWKVVLGDKRGVGEEKGEGVCVLWDRCKANAVTEDTRTQETTGYTEGKEGPTL